MKRIYYILFLAISLFSCEKPISEFQSENFIKFFGGGNESKGNDVIELSGGGYLFTGYDKVNSTDQQIFAGQVDKNGNLVWSNTYGKSDYREEGLIVKEVTDGFLIAGTAVVNTGEGITHSFILKTNEYGDSLWYKEFGDPNYSIVVNDIVIGGSNIFVAGQSYETDVDNSGFYRAKLDLTGEFIFGKSSYSATNSAYKRLFTQGNTLLYTGTYGINNVIAMVSVDQSTMNEMDSQLTTTANESIADASLAGDQLYLLANNLSNTKLLKLNPNLSEEWSTESISSISGISVAHNDDETLMVCGESVDDESNSQINFILVNPDGSAYYGQPFFRTFQGRVGRVIQTSDKGLILIGTTNSTYGANVQLIKTDKDYFMLKN